MTKPKDHTEYASLEVKKGQLIPGQTTKVGLFYPEELTIIKKRGHYLYDSRANYDFNENMVRGIMEIGLSKPVDVQRIRDPNDPAQCILAVVDGRQGVINTLEANRRLEEQGLPKLQIRVTVREEDEILAARRTIMSNNHRKDDDPIVKAEKAREQLNRNVPLEVVCQDFDCVPETMKNWLLLLDLPQAVQLLVQQEKLPIGKALRIRTDVEGVEAQIEAANAIVAGTRRGPGGGATHKGIDKRRIKRIYDLKAAKSPVIVKFLQWIAGEIEDDDVADIIDLTILGKIVPGEDGKKKRKRGTGKGAGGEDFEFKKAFKGKGKMMSGGDAQDGDAEDGDAEDGDAQDSEGEKADSSPKPKSKKKLAIKQHLPEPEAFASDDDAENDDSDDEEFLGDDDEGDNEGGDE